MDNSQSSSQPKQKKGIKKLWAKVKASMKADPSVRDSLTTATTTKPEETTPPAPTIVSTNPSTEPTKKTETDKPTEPTKAMTPGMIEVDDDQSEETYVIASIQPIQANHRSINIPEFISSRTTTSDKERFARAQEVFGKYNMTLDVADWRRSSKSTAERVEKKPRMRVRYTCHECNKVFGREKICSECNHNRCNKCIRYPAKRMGEKAKKEKIETTSTPIAPITTGACHECKTEFTIGADACKNCEHKICERCLRETVMASPLTAPPPTTKPITVAAAS